MSERERVVGSCLSFNIPGYTDEFSGTTHVSCSISSASSPMVNCSGMVSGNIIAIASREQPTHCFSRQTLLVPSSSLPSEESSQKGRYFLFILFIKTLRQNISLSFTCVLTAVDSPAFCIFCTAVGR